MSVCVAGSINLDLVAWVVELPRPGETVMASGLSRHAGGKGLNQAVAAARAGAETRMLGLVGADEAGDWLLQVMGQAGVETTHIGRHPSLPTGQALITVSQAGENAIVVAPGANAGLSAIPIGELAGARVLLAQLETALAPIATLFAAAPPGCLKMLNAAPALADGAQMFATCDVLVFNQTELAAYACAPAATDQRLDDTVRAARSLLAGPDQSVVVTLGAQGALIVNAARAEHLPGRPAHVVDTVGAGDCFCGVLAAGLDEGLDLIAAADRANAAAALAVGRRGAASAMPSRAEIQSVVKLCPPSLT